MNILYKKHTLSVCIVLYNRWELSKKCLQSIAKTVSDEWDIEWCIIDNGSTDETRDELQSFANRLPGEVKLQMLVDAIPQTQAVNRTMNAATGKYMLRTDNDIDYVQGWLEDCFSILKDPSFKDVGFVCPTHHFRQANDNYKPKLTTGETGVEIDMVSDHGLNVPGNLFMRTSVSRDIGGFYTPYNLLNADVHYCLVAKHLGYKWGYAWKTQSPHVGVPDQLTEYSKKAVAERQGEHARYLEIQKGNVADRHPQEIEFVQMINMMLHSKGKTLPWHNDINVLVPSSGRRVELIQLFKNVFDNPRWNGSVYTAGIDHYMPSASESDGHFKLPPIFDEVEYVDAIIALCKELKIRYIFPVIDYDLKVLSVYKKKILREASAEVVCINAIAAEKCFDKMKTAEMFADLDIEAPATFQGPLVFEEGKDYIIKPQFGFASKNITIVKNNEFYNDVPDDYVGQEFIEGKEYTVDLVSDRRFDIISFVSRERLEVRGGEILQGKVVNHLGMFGNFDKISKSLEIIGPWNVQYIIDKNDKAWFIEVNPRFGGGVPISARAGQDQVLNSLKILERDFFGYHQRYLVEWGLTALRFDDCVYKHMAEGKCDADSKGDKRLRG